MSVLYSPAVNKKLCDIAHELMMYGDRLADDREREFVKNMFLQLSRGLTPTDKQRDWLLDLARRFIARRERMWGGQR